MVEVSAEDLTQPTPRSLRTPLVTMQQVERHRNLHCLQYDDCLTVVVVENWRGWTCRYCPGFREQPQPERHPDTRRFK